MYWNGEHEKHLVSKVLVGSGDPTLAGKAKDFATMLDEMSPVIQPLDLSGSNCRRNDSPRFAT